MSIHSVPILHSISDDETTALIDALGKAIGQSQVAFDSTTRYLYSTDASNYQIIPHGVTFPRHADDVTAIHEIAQQFKVPILPRGGGTSLAGQTVGSAIVMDFTHHMRRVTSVNGDERTVQVQPGLVLEQLNKQVSSLGLMFGPDPASANRATMGGCLGNNASGTHSILYHMTADHVHWLDVVLPTGEKVRLGTEAQGHNTSTTTDLREKLKALLSQYQPEISTRYPKTWRTVAGYALNRLNPADIDLAQLIIGSEGSLATIVEAKLALVPRPRMTCLAILHFDKLRNSLEIVPAILEMQPSAIELLDATLIGRTRNQPEFARRLHFVDGNPAAILIVEFYGDNDQELRDKVGKLKAHLSHSGYKGTTIELYDPRLQKDVWTVRKAGLGLLASNRSDWKTVALIEDAAVPVDQLANYIDRIQTIVKNAGAELSLYAHASAGCLHVRPLLNLKTEEGLRQYRQIGEQAADAVLEFDGTTSGEHGEGLTRGEFSERLFGTALVQAFREVKAIFDPYHLMNPGKIIDAPPMDDSRLMRYGIDYATPLEPINTRFDWQSDGGFAGAVEMCNGAGVCRKEDSGVMCPSFMATRAEHDSTRGRANILRLAMTGQVGLDGLKDGRVKDVLDLCLSCKACKAECPSAVDMARIKAEFQATYYDQHGIPLRSRVFANVHRLNKIGGKFPSLTNRLTGMPIVSPFGKKLMGIAQEHDLPKFAPKPFTKWFAKNSTATHGNMSTPILLVDTFMEYYDPQIGQALDFVMCQMKMVLKAQALPGQGCCGRPAISKGLLDQAKHMSNSLIDGLAKLIAENPDIRFMMVEPSCISALRDDVIGLVDQDRRQLAYQIAEKTLSIEEWLEECRQKGHFVDLKWDGVIRHILYHGHCHQKSLWGTTATLSILQAIPHATVSELDTGCCGMAGSFGYEVEHVEVSKTIASQRLWPSIEEYPEAIVVASGTSCREQIGVIKRKSFHPIEVIAMALGWKGV